MKTHRLAVVALALGLGACATVPTGPSVMVLPGSAKTFEQFQVDDAVCRQWAHQQTGITAGKASSNTTATGAVAGTAIGAAAGAAIGAAAGNPAAGAAAWSSNTRGPPSREPPGSGCPWRTCTA